MKKGTICFFLFIPLFMMAQTQEKYSSWSSLIIDYKLSDNFYLKNEAHFRRTKFLSAWQQILLRPSFHYKYNETVDFAVGYTYSRNYRNTRNFNENDAWEQMQLSHKSNKSSFKHRFRLEQRFIEKVVQTPNGNYDIEGINFKMRFRYRFTWSMPLFKITEGKSIGITAFDEIWLNTDKGIVPKQINQNWFYAGLSYPLFKKASIGIGFLDAFAPVGNSNHNFINNNILQTTIKYHL